MTYVSVARSVLVLITLPALIPVTAAARQSSVGNIIGIAKVGSEGVKDSVLNTTPNVRIWRSQGWRNVAKDDGVFRLDSLEVTRYHDLKLDVAPTGSRQKGALTFSPDFFEKGGRIVSLGATDSMPVANYQFVAGPDGGADTAIRIGSGSLLVDWKQGELTVFAADNKIIVPGTKVLIRVSADGQEARVFVLEGIVTVLNPQLGQQQQLTQRQLFRVDPNAMPQQVTGFQGSARSIDELFKYNHSQIYGAGLSPLGIGILGAVGAGTGVGVLAVLGVFSNDTGTISIDITHN